MEGNSWRPAQGEPSAADAAAGDWRSRLQHDARQRIVNKIMDTLKRHLPISVPEGLNELQKISVRFEEKIYTAATSQSDYLRKISLKMLSMETKTQHTLPINHSMPNNTVPNQNPMDPASTDSTAQTGLAVVTDLQEEIYQKIKSMKEMYFADLSELYQKIAIKLQQHDSLIPPAKPSDHHEKMKCVKFMLERTLAVLQISKNNIQLGLKEKLPLYEKQIINILASNKKKVIPSQPQGQQQFQHPGGFAHSMPQQQQSQLTQLQQHDNHPNQVQQVNLQSSATSMQPAAVTGMQHVSMPLPTSFGIPTTQQNITSALHSGSNLDPVQGSSFNSLQQGAMGAVQHGGVGSVPSTINAPQQTNVNAPSNSSMNPLKPTAILMQPSSNTLQQQHLKQHVGHQQSTVAPPQAQSLAVGTPGISASTFLAEYTSPDGNQANVLGVAPGKISASERLLEHLIKVDGGCEVYKRIDPPMYACSKQIIPELLRRINNLEREIERSKRRSWCMWAWLMVSWLLLILLVCQ